MSISKRALRVAIASMAAFAVMVAVSAASASAATFSASTMKLTTSGVTVKRGTETKTCTLSTGESSGETGGEAAFVSNAILTNGLPITRFECSGGTKLELFTYLWGIFNPSTKKYSLGVEEYQGVEPALQSPWGPYLQYTFEVPWNNGSGSTPSTIVFNETTIGNIGLAQVKLTGTIKATTASGGLLTLK